MTSAEDSEPVASSTRSCAWLESESEATKPPLASSTPKIGPPIAPATTTASSVTSSVRRGWALTFSVTLPSIESCLRVGGKPFRSVTLHM